MKRDWKLSAPLFSRSSKRRRPRRSLYRQIVAPERLESRNAPGALLPMLPMGDLGLSDGTEAWDVSEPAVEVRSGAISESTLPSFGWKESLAPVIEPLQAVQIQQEQLVDEPTLAAAESQIPLDLAVLDAAFESLGSLGPSLPTMENPAFLEPVDDAADPQVLQEMPQPVAAASGAAAMSHSTATGGGTDSGSAATVPQSAAPHSSPPTQTVGADTATALNSTISPLAVNQLTETDVQQLLERASRATSRNDAIIAIVDRSGQILGVRLEADVLANIPDAATRAFAIDGAIAKARTAAFFSNDEAILTSRTVRFISQSTVTQREVEANPNSTNQDVRGPGFVAPIGLGGHFPPDVLHTPHVDLFAIEHTNRDSLLHPGPDRIRQTATVDNDGNPTAASGDDIFLGTRFGADFAAGKEIPAPESYGLVTDTLSNSQSRGIATLPGGVPLYKTDTDGQQRLVGGIGVFFPGDDGYATFEQAFVAGQSTAARLNAPLVLEAEYTAALVAKNVGNIGGAAPVAGIGFPGLPGGGRIDLVGITLESFGPHPFKLDSFLAHEGGKVTQDADGSGMNVPVTKGGDLLLPGEDVPDGWLVEPTASSELTADEVRDIIERGIEEAEKVRAAIRLPLGERTSMVLSVTDLDGKVLALYRMPDATFFSIDVAVAKARNVAYYADATELEPIDQVPGVDAGVAFTNRTFRFVAEPRFPSGVDGSESPAFSTLNTPGINPDNAENLTGNIPDANDFQTPLGFDAFNPGSNFHEDVSPDGYQNGVVFFPGSTPLYRNGVLVGGLGVSGDGVDQDDVVTFSAAGEFLPRLNANDSVTRADEVIVDGVRLPYQKFLRNPRA